MTELMKRYEAETGRKPKDLFMGSEESLIHFTREYVEWLEAKVLDGETIEKFQEIIRNQCDEISALKAQLTWRPVSEKPEKDGMYLAKVRLYEGCETLTTKIVHFNGEQFPWWDVVNWLPIPPAQEGEC